MSAISYSRCTFFLLGQVALARGKYNMTLGFNIFTLGYGNTGLGLVNIAVNYQYTI